MKQYGLGRTLPSMIAVVGSVVALLLAPASTAEPAQTRTPPPERVAWIASFPHVVLENPHAELWVARPSGASGYNRAKRFDRGGMVLWARAASGLDYFGPLTDADTHNPDRHDHVAGTAGEFGIHHPLGYADAAPGEAFLKIGVGLLQRTDARPYRFFRKYPSLDPGVWTVETADDAVEMVHTLNTDAGWAYTYTSRVRLAPDHPGFTIERSLTNRGTQRLQTSYYNHHFVLLEGRRAGPGHAITLEPSHQPRSDRPPSPLADFDGRRFEIQRPLGEKSVTVDLLPVFPASSPHHWQADFTADHTDARLSVTHTPTPAHVVLYAREPYFSVEPFIEIDLAPGESFRWTATYVLQ
ncbi:MAG: hypothetical protein AAGG38_01050 [Planctomycetota bacterium]